MNNQETEKSLEEAAQWLARLEAVGQTESERAELLRWLRQDRVHADAFAAAEIVSDGVRKLAEVDPAFSAMVDEAYAMGAGDTAASPAPRPRIGRRWAVPLSLAASLLLAAVGIQIAYRAGQPAMAPVVHAADYRPREVQLADGSKINLDAGSTVRVSLGEKARRVELLKGRALFSVAHDRTRPFSVSAVGSRTTALGTRFQVEQRDGAVTVTLAEGSVAVDGMEESRTRHQKLIPGEQLSIAAGADGRWAKTRVDPDTVTSWSRGRLIFRSKPLAEAIAEVNRYSKVQLVLADPGLSTLEVSGNFIPGDSRAILAAFEAVLPLRVVDNGDEILMFRRYRDVSG